VARDVGERVVLEVSDTGAGMAPEVRARVFEPFFTTRAEEGGMGMGLPLTRSLVLEAGGEIAVESEPGRGTTLRVTLPVAPEPGTAAPAPAPPPKPPRARVLVVDDEPLVGRAVARILAAHEVETVTTAREAMAKLRGPEPFDAVVCDLMMPEMTGMDLHDVLLAEQSEYAGRLVFLTGGAFTERARDFVARTAAPVLDKPVDAEALRAAVAELAAASRAR
jgi:CheY-like chemotaxis protein